MSSITQIGQADWKRKTNVELIFMSTGEFTDLFPVLKDEETWQLVRYVIYDIELRLDTDLQKMDDE